MQDNSSLFLTDYLAQWGGRIPFGPALGVLDNVLRELAAMHRSGAVHGDVCPETIYVSGNRAYLLNRGYAGGSAAIRPGFTSPEQYRADGRVGPWSDVYAAGAVLFRMVTGTNPPDAAQRMAPGSAPISFGDAQADGANIQAVMAALALDLRYRPQSCAEFLATLALPDLSTLPPAGIPAAAASGEAHARKKWSVKKRAIVICSSILAGLGLCAGGFFLYTDILYNRAVTCITQQKDYGRAIDALKGVLASYKSSGNWMAYACAADSLEQGQYYNARKGFESLGAFNHADDMLPEVNYRQAGSALEKGDFAQAKDMFTALGPYKDAAQMILECDYRKAGDELQKNDYDDAVTGFTQLSAGSYKDSATMLLEAKYRKAIDIAGRGDDITAYKMFQDLGAYKDSAMFLNNVTDQIYNKGISFYRIRSYTKAKEDFTLIKTYKRSADYLTLIDGNEFLIKYPDGDTPDSDAAQTLYNNLVALKDLEDAAAIRASAGFLYYRLTGTWSGDGGLYFKLGHDAQGWHSSYNLPRFEGNDGFALGNNYYLVWNNKKWVFQFQFRFDSESQMKVYCFVDGKTYTLTR